MLKRSVWFISLLLLSFLIDRGTAAALYIICQYSSFFVVERNETVHMIPVLLEVAW